MDKKLQTLIARAAQNGASGHMMNMLHDAASYSGILEAVVNAGSLMEVARQVGVSHQAVQQWVKAGWVPTARIPEVESLYGIPRALLMNPKYSSILAAPNFDCADEIPTVLVRVPRAVPVLDADDEA